MNAVVYPPLRDVGIPSRCGLELETPTQTTPDWETRPESQKPLGAPNLSAQMTSAEDGLRPHTPSPPLFPFPSFPTYHRRHYPVSVEDFVIRGSRRLRWSLRFTCCPSLVLLCLFKFIPKTGPG